MGIAITPLPASLALSRLLRHSTQYHVDMLLFDIAVACHMLRHIYALDAMLLLLKSAL